jgi:bifunctional ADP-heptose synthase (sugar kinase/adenylyltransferase)
LPSKNYKSCVKTRFIDKTTSYKLFGSYIISSLDNLEFYKSLYSKLNKEISKNDIIIIADYSNNFFNNKSLLNKIRKSKKFISAMVQKNSNNPSFFSLNNIRKF